MGSARRAFELAAVGLLGLAIVITASGWLYLIRADVLMPGPSMPGALPLDALPGRSSMPLLPFLAVWGGAAVLLGLLARVARIERLTSALLFAVTTGSLLFAATGVSVFVVDQIPAGEAFHSAARAPSIYVAAAVAGLGGAILGNRHRAIHRRAPAVLAVLVATSGLLDLASAVTPAIGTRLRLVEDVTPNALPNLARALVVPTGLALILLARSLYRRRRRAWQLTLALVLAAAVLHLLKGLDYEEAIASILLGLALVARRHDFEGRGDPQRRAHLLVRGALYLVAIFAYGTAALWINRVTADRPYTFAFALEQTARSLVGAQLHGSAHLSGAFGEWFPLSVFVGGVMCGLAVLWTWLAPWGYRLSQSARDREVARVLVDSFGSDTLAPFALRADKSYFFSEDEEAFLAYKVVAGVAVVSGDPIGPPEAIRPLLERFLAFTRDRDWRLAILGAGERNLAVYRELGLRALYHGDEAIVDVAGFSLEGRAIRKVRQSVTRLERAGYRAELRPAGEIDDLLRADLEDVARQWRGDAPEKGFTMELDTLFRLDGEDAVFMLGFDEHGAVSGFLHFAVAQHGRTLSLSSMPRRRDTPNGFNEWLVVATIEWAAEHGFEQVSMNFSPFAELLAPDLDQSLPGHKRLQRRALTALKGRGFQLENLLAFNRKFFPHWQRRYLVYQRRLDLPRVGIAGLAAEGYLPLAGTRR